MLQWLKSVIALQEGFDMYNITLCFYRTSSSSSLITWKAVNRMRKQEEKVHVIFGVRFMWYHIAENFWGKKLPRISRFCGYTRKFSPWNLGRSVIWHCKSEQSVKVFSTKIVFSPIRESFLPWKFSTIRQVKHATNDQKLELEEAWKDKQLTSLTVIPALFRVWTFRASCNTDVYMSS